MGTEPPPRQSRSVSHTVMNTWVLIPFLKNLVCASEIFHNKLTKRSQVTDFTSTRNHFPLQWKRQTFPQKGNEMKYSEVMCYKTEMRDTFITLSKERVAASLQKHHCGSGRLEPPYAVRLPGGVCCGACMRAMELFCLISRTLLMASSPPPPHTWPVNQPC